MQSKMKLMQQIASIDDEIARLYQEKSRLQNQLNEIVSKEHFGNQENNQVLLNENYANL